MSPLVGRIGGSHPGTVTDNARDRDPTRLSTALRGSQTSSVGWVVTTAGIERHIRRDLPGLPACVGHMPLYTGAVESGINMKQTLKPRLWSS